MAKHLDISLIITSKDTFDITIYEPESGDCITVHCHDNGEEIHTENEKIANEIRSWIGIIRDEIAEAIKDGDFIKDLLMEQQEQM
jgi:hypothetical protein